tara:strand:+ start:1604 stop:1705 length:102 start_codon:yes stop_codon:yes gene_type:complete
MELIIIGALVFSLCLVFSVAGSKALRVIEKVKK